MEFLYSGELFSETGLEKVVSALTGCSSRVELCTSGYNGMPYLRTPLTEEEIDLDMDSGQTSPFLFGGTVDGTAERALALLGEFSQCLTSSGIPHRVELYDESHEEIGYLHYKWPHGQCGPIGE